jgi:hypothetical protein
MSNGSCSDLGLDGGEFNFQVPYLSPATGIVTWWLGNSEACLSSVADSATDANLHALHLAVQNLANPDWQNLFSQTPTFQIGNLKNSGVIAIPASSGVVLNLSVVPGSIDTWYQSKTFGLYGVVNEANGVGGYDSENHWINNPVTGVRFAYPASTGFSYNFKGGVTATATFYTTLAPPKIIVLGNPFSFPGP